MLINNDDILYHFEINDYIKQVEISKARRAKYRTLKSGEKKISNPKTAGKPRYFKINGQDLWSGIDHNLRSKVAKEIKKYFYNNYFRDIKEIEEFPIGIYLGFYGELGDFDIDNLVVWYRKCIADALAGNVEFKKQVTNGKVRYVADKAKFPPKIPDDSVKFIRAIPTEFIESETNKLIITIFKY